MSLESGRLLDDGAAPHGAPASTRDELVAIFDRLPVMVAYWNNDLRNVFANESYCRWFDMSTSDIHGRHMKDVIGPGPFARDLPFLQGALAGRAQTFERAVVDPAGRSGHVHTSFTPYLVDGVVEGFFAFGTDVTARVEADAAHAETVKRAAASDERERIASALHATVLQRLFAATLELEAATQSDRLDAAERIRTAIAGIDAAISDLRATVRIGPSTSGLTTAMDQIVGRVAATLGFEARRSYGGALDRLPSTTWAELLTVLSEALAAAAQHPLANQVNIVITAYPTEVELRVADNGPGPDHPGRSAALSRMRGEAERLGGTFTWEPNLPGGTVIHWRVPVTGPQPVDAEPRADGGRR